MYEGAPDYPDKDIWWEIAERNKATILYTAPTAIRACMKWGADYPSKHDLSSLRLLGTVGEPINPKAWLWYYEVIGGERCPIVDTWWQTETGHIMISPLPGVIDAKPGSATRPLPGVDAAVVDDDGNEVDGEQGLLVLRRPWPGMLRTLYKEEERFKDTYYAQVRRDDLLRRRRRAKGRGRLLLGPRPRRRRGQRLRAPALHCGGRVRDRLAPEGRRVRGDRPSTDEDTGQAICAFVTLEGDLEGSEEIQKEINDHVAKRISKIARPKRIIWAGDLPKTRSGKIMRRLLRDIGEGRELGDVTTLRDPTVMEQLDEKVRERHEEED